jgi:GAF domain-containing protein
LDEARLLHLVAQTARDLTDAEFAAFTLRPLDELGQPLGPSEGNLFFLASVVGVTKAQEQLLRHMQLGGEGLLAPIFRQGVPMRVPDALALMHDVEQMRRITDAATAGSSREVARQMEQLQALGVPRGHPLIRSFLGAPLLNHSQQVIGGLLLGHSESGQFMPEDEALMLGLAAQATVSLENARLYRTAQMHAQELDATFESIADGVTLLDSQGHILRENGTSPSLARATRRH